MHLPKKRGAIIAAVGGICAAGLVAAACCRMLTPDPATMNEAEKREAIARMYATYREDFPDAPEASVAQLLEWRAADAAVVVDAREEREIAVSRIPGALPLEEFRAREEQYRGKKVVAYCTIGARSGVCTTHLVREGFDAYNLKGSILSWLHEGQPVVDSAGDEVKAVHVYGKKWALAPEGYENVY